MPTDPTSRIHEDESATVLATGERTIHQIPVLTVKKLAEKLAQIEADGKCGYERALLCVEMLSYESLNALVEQGGPDNDPHLMPSRFCILKGATDKGLKAKGNLDAFGPRVGSVKYEMHERAPHTMSVQSLGDLLVLGGYLPGDPPRWCEPPKGAEDTVAPAGTPRVFEEMDDELVDALNVYLDRGMQPLPDWELPDVRKVDEDDSLSSIARELGIRNWRLIWELNRGALGDKWDRPPVGTELVMPDPSKDPLGDEGSFAEWLDGFSHPLEFADKGYQYPGIYLSLTILDDRGEVAKFDPPVPFGVHARGTDDLPVLIHHVDLSKGDEIDFVVPDAPNIGWGLEGHPIASLGSAWLYYTEDVGGKDPDDAPDGGLFQHAAELLKEHVETNKAVQK